MQRLKTKIEGRDLEDNTGIKKPERSFRMKNRSGVLKSISKKQNQRIQTYDLQIDYLSKAVVNKKFQERSRTGIERNRCLPEKGGRKGIC